MRFRLTSSFDGKKIKITSNNKNSPSQKKVRTDSEDDKSTISLSELLDFTHARTRDDITTRFDEIAWKLDAAFSFASERSDVNIMSALLSMWSEICVDATLCKKLLQKGAKDCCESVRLCHD